MQIDEILIKFHLTGKAHLILQFRRLPLSNNIKAMTTVALGKEVPVVIESSFMTYLFLAFP